MASPDMSSEEDLGKSEILLIRTPEELDDFWREILPNFLEVVDPENSLIVEELYSSTTLTDTDFESLVTGRGVVPRKQKARKLWMTLSSHNLDVFNEKVAPKLYAEFRHIVPPKFLKKQCLGPAEHHKLNTQCLRHVIEKRVRLETFADLLCHLGCLSRDDYVAVISEAAGMSVDKWGFLFEATKQKPLGDSEQLEKSLRELLTRYDVCLPDNMADILSCGIPCTCQHPSMPQADRSKNGLKRVRSWLERRHAALYQKSPDSSFTKVDVSSEGHSSELKSVSQLEGSVTSAEDKLPDVDEASGGSLTPEYEECTEQNEQGHFGDPHLGHASHTITISEETHKEETEICKPALESVVSNTPDGEFLDSSPEISQRGESATAWELESVQSIQASSTDVTGRTVQNLSSWKSGPGNRIPDFVTVRYAPFEKYAKEGLCHYCMKCCDYCENFYVATVDATHHFCRSRKLRGVCRVSNSLVYFTLFSVAIFLVYILSGILNDSLDIIKVLSGIGVAFLLIFAVLFFKIALCSCCSLWTRTVKMSYDEYNLKRSLYGYFNSDFEYPGYICERK